MAGKITGGMGGGAIGGMTNGPVEGVGDAATMSMMLLTARKGDYTVTVQIIPTNMMAMMTDSTVAIALAEHEKAIARKVLASLYKTMTIRGALVQMGTKTIDRAKWGIRDDGPERSVAYGASHVRVAYPSLDRDGVRVVFVAHKRIGRDRIYGAPDDAKRYASWHSGIRHRASDYI